MVESKFYNKKNSNQNRSNRLKKEVRSFIMRVLLTIIVTLVLLIAFKLDASFKTTFKRYVYDMSLPFTDFKKIYNNYFEGKKIVSNKVDSVFYEKLSYSSKSMYEDGVKLIVNDHYLVPSLDSGIVVFIGDKDKYGKTVIVQQMNGVDVFYGNVNSNVNMYDYIEKGSLIGESIGDKIYLAFQKEGKFVDYKKYIK